MYILCINMNVLTAGLQGSGTATAGRWYQPPQLCWIVPSASNQVSFPVEPLGTWGSWKGQGMEGVLGLVWTPMSVELGMHTWPRVSLATLTPLHMWRPSPNHFEGHCRSRYLFHPFSRKFPLFQTPPGFPTAFRIKCTFLAGFIKLSSSRPLSQVHSSPNFKNTEGSGFYFFMALPSSIHERLFSILFYFMLPFLFHSHS